MKKITLTIIIIILIFEILMFPQMAMSYAATGLSLWFDNMIPALFPFMVISGLIIRLDLVQHILVFLHPVLYKIFHTNPYCEYACVMGFLCGYPMGAVIVRDLLSEHKISVKQADYLLCFCNNIGPVFFFSLVLPLFDGYQALLLTGMYIIPFVYGIFMRYSFYKKAFTGDCCRNSIISDISKNDVTTPKNYSFHHAFTDSINQAVSSSLYLGACMIFFNMLRFIPSLIFRGNSTVQAFISWLLEVNGALNLTGEIYAEINSFGALSMLPFLAIGGLSCMCQTAGILSGTGCNLKQHFIHKGIQALLWLILTLLWLLIEFQLLD